MNKIFAFSRTFLSYYLTSTAITAFLMFLVALLLIASEVLPRDLSFLITSFLYYLILIVLSIFYYPHRQQRSYKDIVFWTLVVIFLHKLLITSTGGIGGWIINGMHYSITSIVLANLVVAYLSDNDAQPKTLFKVVKIGSLIYFSEAIFNSLFYFSHYYNKTSSHFTGDPFSDNPNTFIALQFSYYLGYLLAIYLFYRSYPFIKHICTKLGKYNVVCDIIKILLAPVGVMAFLLALTFA